MFSTQGLIRYLMAAENDVIDSVKYCLNEDMTLPLCHYFINSSHNTYLSGHQITGYENFIVLETCLYHILLYSVIFIYETIFIVAN
jgi:hypothetical protein